MATITSVGRASGVEPLELTYDARAAAGLYERHAGRVFGYCLSRLRRRDEAEDAAQTTFLHAIRSLRKGVVPESESAWLLGIARNVCLARWEASGRRSRTETVCDPVELDVAGEAPQVRDELVGLQDALARLPEMQRRAVLLRDWRGLSYEEVAAELGVTVAAVETLIFRGRRTLADLLRDEPARKRRFSLGDLGSLLAALKSAFGGGAAAVKVALAVAAVSGTGLVLGSAVGGDGGARRPAATQPARTPAPVASRPAPTPAVSPVTRRPAEPVRRQSGTGPARPAKAQAHTAGRPRDAAPFAEQPVASAPAGAAAAASAPPADPAREAPAAPAVDDRAAHKVVPALTSTVTSTVEGAADELPVETPPPPPLPLPVTVTVPSVSVPELPVSTPTVSTPTVSTPTLTTPSLPSTPLDPVADAVTGAVPSLP